MPTYPLGGLFWTTEGQVTDVVDTRLSYTDAQMAAITSIDSNLQIVACAGSGKTQVVAERIAYILEQRLTEGITPANIVAFTFTDRAAVELKDRVYERVAARCGALKGMAEMYVGTIHGYCLNILQTHLPTYFKYQVLTDVQTRIFIDRNSQKSGLTGMVASTGTQMRRYVNSRLYMEVLSVLREDRMDEANLDDGERAQLAMCRDSLAVYRELLDKHRYLDYAEIMVRAVDALRSDSDLREELGARVQYLIVDEYQDVNPLQEELVRILHDLGANLCVVGDDDQTIYQWRGSDVHNILTFADRYPGVRTATIDDNFRSSQGVIDAASTVIEFNEPDRLQKAMRFAGAEPYALGDLLGLSFESPEQEAAWIAAKVRELVGVPFADKPDEAPRGLSYSDFAVLLRSAKQDAAPIVKALRDAKLPVLVVGMTGLFETPEAQAAASIFHFMAGEISRVELRGLWLAAGLGIDPRDLEGAIDGLEAERNWDTTQRFAVYNLQRTFLRFLERVVLREEHVVSGRGEVVYYNLGKFSQVISDFEQIHFQSDPERKYLSFADFLTYQAPGYYPEGWQDVAYVRPDAVQVMTVHQAKGMQWPAVFVPALQRNRFPSKRQGGLGKFHFLPRAALAEADRYDGSVPDERRLFYVALTRSKKYLFCSWAPRAGNKLYRHPSVFLQEFCSSDRVLTREAPTRSQGKLSAVARGHVANVALSFSELKYLLSCPYQFKLRFLYGFNAPLAEALGYGKSLHDALAEVHKRAQQGDIVSEDEAAALVERTSTCRLPTTLCASSCVPRRLPRCSDTYARIAARSTELPACRAGG